MSGLLVVTAVEVEREAISTPLGADHPARIGPYEAYRGRGVTVLAGGVGPACAAAATATALALAETPDMYSLVVSAGIGGGFAGRCAVGGIVEASVIVAADLGAESAAGFVPVTELGFGFDEVAGAPLGIAQARRGPVLTVSTVTGTQERTAELAGRGGFAEAMEGFGVAVAATRFGLPVGELRAISNVVGDRDRSGWDFEGALKALNAAAADLKGAVT